MNKDLLKIIATAVLLLAAYITTENVEMSMSSRLAIYLVPYLLIGYDVLKEAVEGIMEGDPFDENFLMSIATIGALGIGFLPGGESQFVEAVFVMLFFRVGEMFEDYAEDKSRDSIAELMDIRPDTACVVRDGQTITLPPDDVQVGETLVVKPGDKIALDGVVIEGASALNTVALTGESMPRDVAEGDDVVSGCVNLSGVLKVRVSKLYGESTAAKIIRLVKESAENKSKSETFIRRFARVYTPVVVLSALALAVIPPFFAPDYGAAFTTWLYRALTFLVVSCPCALVMSVPLTFFAGIGGASSKGILVKGGNYMDALAKTATVVFDKTGTLTQGVFAVESVCPDRLSEADLLHLAARAEQFSNHPIAVALRQAAPIAPRTDSAEQVEEIGGQGIRAVIDGQTVCVGNDRMMQRSGIEPPTCARCEAHAGTLVHVAVDGAYAGHIAISDKVKSDAADTMTRLARMGVSHTVMLTGDRETVGRAVAAQLGIAETHCDLLPADKVAHVERLLGAKAPDTCLAFVGDGINDAPVLALSDVGIAMGALGSDAAIEAADVVLMDDKPSNIAEAIRIARRTVGIARQNAWFAIGVKVAILGVVAAGLLGSRAMGVAVFGDVGVMVLAVLNAMRAMRV